MNLYAFTPDEPEVKAFFVMSDSEESATKLVNEIIESTGMFPAGHTSTEYDLWKAGEYFLEVLDCNKPIAW